jgi:hypothetical protein
VVPIEQIGERLARHSPVGEVGMRAAEPLGGDRVAVPRRGRVCAADHAREHGRPAEARLDPVVRIGLNLAEEDLAPALAHGRALEGARPVRLGKGLLRSLGGIDAQPAPRAALFQADRVAVDLWPRGGEVDEVERRRSSRHDDVIKQLHHHEVLADLAAVLYVASHRVDVDAVPSEWAIA